MESSKLTILVVEDSAQEARMMAEMLSCARHVKFSMERVMLLEAATERLESPSADLAPVDAVLVDMRVPDGDALVDFLKTHSLWQGVAVIVVAGVYNEKLAMQAVQHGAQDYLLKDYLSADQLERTIRYAIERKRLQDALGRQTQIMESVLNSLSDGVAVVDVAGHCLLTNPAAEKIAGIVGTNVAHKKWPSHYGIYRTDNAVHYDAESLPLTRACQGETVREQELFIRNARVPEGVLVSVNASPLRDDQGHVRGGVAIFREVTRYPLTEEQIRQIQELIG